MQPYLRVEHHLLRDGTDFSSVHEKMIYLILCSYAGQDGLAFPSHQTLADAVPCSKTTVKTCLQTLVEKGRIEKAERFDRHGGQTSNGYRICADNPVGSRQETGQTTPAGVADRALEEKGVKKQILKKESSSPTDQGIDGIIRHFETEIGRITPSIRDQLGQLIDETSSIAVRHAIEQAAAANVRNWNYVKAIIIKLKQQNLLTPEQINRHEAERRNKPVRRQTNRSASKKLPDWVERERWQQQQAEREQKRRFEQAVPDQTELKQLLAALI